MKCEFLCYSAAHIAAYSWDIEKSEQMIFHYNYIGRVALFSSGSLFIYQDIFWLLFLLGWRQKYRNSQYYYYFEITFCTARHTFHSETFSKFQTRSLIIRFITAACIRCACLLCFHARCATSRRGGDDASKKSRRNGRRIPFRMVGIWMWLKKKPHCSGSTHFAHTCKATR